MPFWPQTPGETSRIRQPQQGGLRAAVARYLLCDHTDGMTTSHPAAGKA